MQLFVLIQTSTIFISCGYPHWCQLEGPKAEVNGNNKILLDNRTVCFWTLYPYSSRPPVSTEGMLTFTLPGEGIPSLKERTRMHTYACTLTQTYRPPPPNTSDACLLCCEMWWFMRYVLNHHINHNAVDVNSQEAYNSTKVKFTSKLWMGMWFVCLLRKKQP